MMSDQTGERNTLMIVEDEPIIALDLALQAEDLGYNVMGPFGTLKSAVDALTDNTPDLAMLDFNLPDGTIQSVVSILKDRDIPMVVVSGQSEKYLRTAGIIDVPFVEKPTLLQDALSAILASH